MNWLYLGIAVTFEIMVALAASKANGFTDPLWTAATLVSGAIATFFLSLALLTFDVGVGYALWTSVAGVGLSVSARCSSASVCPGGSFSRRQR